MTYINKFSYKCLLGPQSRDVVETSDLYIWRVNKKHHFTTAIDLNQNHIDILKQYGILNFHYLSEANMIYLKSNGSVDKAKNASVTLDISDLSLKGSKFASIRHAINRCTKSNLTIKDNFNDISDVKNLIEEWSNNYTDKYFRDHSGKNMFFYKNNFHLDCINAFIYDGDVLVAFGTLSTEPCSYIIGKALFKRHYGLSEYADYILYQKAQRLNITKVNMGQAEKGLVHYKMKFPGASSEIHYNGTVKF